MPEKTFKILIIDDSPEDRDLYKRFLCGDQECTYHFEEADHGAEGLQRLLATDFDLALLDFELPDFNGLEFLSKLKEKPSSLKQNPPVVMITGRGDERVAVKALRLGAYDYVVKSDLTPENLYRATKNAIEKRDQEDKLAAERENLRISQEHFSLLVEGVHDHAMILLDKDGKITQWNKGAEKLTGFEAHEVMDRHIDILFDQKDQMKGFPDEELRRAQAFGRYEVDHWLVKKSGQRFWATGSVSLLYTADGVMRGFAKVIRDDTQKKLFEQEKANEGKWFENLFDFLPVPFLLIEPRTGRMLFANRAAHQTVGGHFAVAESFEDYQRLYDRRDEDGNALPLEKMLAFRASLGERITGEQVEWDTGKGKKSFLVDATLIPPLYGREPVVALTFQDVTKLKQAQEDLKEAKQSAEHASQAKSHFLANMSHEIRTPLGAIMGFAELLARQPTNEAERLKFAATIKRNGKTLMQIIDDILDLSKIEAGKLDFEIVDIEIRKLIADVLELFSVRAADQGVVLKSRIDDAIPEKMRSDPTRLRQILFNTLGNAIKFTDQGEVSLNVRMINKTSRAGNEALIEIEISDTGVGISEEQQKRLFKPFSQADSSTTRKFGGTGLGLMLTRRLAEAMGGNFELIKSEVRQGSTFAVQLPLHMAQEAEKKDDFSSSPPIGRRLEGKKILVIEDSEDNRALIEKLLSVEGASVRVASNGAEGIELSRHGKFDLVLTDIQMPVMDGYVATQALRRDGFTGPILGLTAHAFREDKMRSKANGLTEHLTKPIDGDELIRQIVFHLGASLREKLKTQTRALHLELENLLDVMNKDLSPDKYDQILIGFYEIHRSFEEFLQVRAGEGCEISNFYLNERSKVSWLEEDLFNLNTRKTEILTKNPPSFGLLNSKERVLGALYVVEGSTLGAQVILQHLKQLAPRFKPNAGLRFFQGYGSATGSNWRHFLRLLERVSTSEHEETAAGASHMFKLMISHFKEEVGIGTEVNG